MFEKVKRTEALKSWIMRQQPVAFSNAEHLYTDLILLRDQLFEYGDLSDSQVDYLNNFIDNFDTNLDTTVDKILTEWVENGVFDNIIKEGIFPEFVAQLNNFDNKFSAKANELKLEMTQYVDEITSGLTSGTPKVFLNSYNELIEKYPNGSDQPIGVYEPDGKTVYIYTWDGTRWNKGALWGETGIPDGGITTEKIATNAVTPEKISNLVNDFRNAVSTSTFIPGEYYNREGILVKEGDEGYLSGYGRTPLIPVNFGDTLRRNNKVSSTDNGEIVTTFFEDSGALRHVSSHNWPWRPNTSSANQTVVANANFVTFSVHERALTQGGVITVNELLKLKQNEVNVTVDNFARLPYRTPFASIVPAVNQSGYMTLDREKKTLTIDRRLGLVFWSANYKFIDSSSGRGDIVFTFDEISAITGSGSYNYMFLDLQKARVTSGKDIFKFTPATGFADMWGPSGGNRDIYSYENLIPIGAFNMIDDFQFFPNSNFKVVRPTDVTQTKRVSILGDSISTYAGYIPNGNATFYPNDYLSNVNLTWWKKMIDNSNGKLELLVNNSWSGSRVSTPSTSPATDRATSLHTSGIDPDIIIFYEGINDFRGAVPIGTWDGTTPVPTDKSTFRSAYAEVLDMMTKRYPNALIYCTTLLYNSPSGSPVSPVNSNGVRLSEFNNSVREISKIFGCEILDFERSGFNYNTISTLTIDRLHPNPSGMDLMAQTALLTVANV